MATSATATANMFIESSMVPMKQESRVYTRKPRSDDRLVQPEREDDDVILQNNRELRLNQDSNATDSAGFGYRRQVDEE